MRPEELKMWVDASLGELMEDPSGAPVERFVRQLEHLPPPARMLVQRELVRRLTQIEQARRELEELRQEAEQLTQPPLHQGILTEIMHGGNGDAHAVVCQGGRFVETLIGPQVDASQLGVGDRVALGPDNNALIAHRGPSSTGEVGVVLEVLPDDRLLVEENAGSALVLRRASAVASAKIEPGDRVRYDRLAGLVFEILPQDNHRVEVDSYAPATFAEVGGLKRQIEQITEAIFWPLKYPARFEAYGLRMPRGILLQGPPGCGKTLLARATITELISYLSGNSQKESIRIKEHFLYVKGPELLSMWVGETERAIRNVFARARETARRTGLPVLIFWDEIESMVPIRGSRVSSSVDATIVPTLLSEMDGLDSTAQDQILLMAATNRPDVVDPAIVRPGRFDRVLEIPRPDRKAAAEILRIHFRPELPYLADHEGVGEPVERLIECVLGLIFSKSQEEAQIATLVLRDGSRRPVYRSDLFSGAAARNIVQRSAARALRREIASEELTSTIGGRRSGRRRGEHASEMRLKVAERRGICAEDVVAAVREEFKGLGRILSPRNVASYVPIRDGQEVVAVEPVQGAASRAYRLVS